jgi:hypothetical protein
VKEGNLEEEEEEAGRRESEMARAHAEAAGRRMR